MSPSHSNAERFSDMNRLKYDDQTKAAQTIDIKIIKKSNEQVNESEPND